MKQPRQNLNQKWFNHCQTEEECEEFRKRLLENRDILEALDNILISKMSENARERRSKDGYEKPAWSEFQADCNAVERTLESIRTFLKISKET